MSKYKRKTKISAPLRYEPLSRSVCSNCHKTYGKHFGDECVWDGSGTKFKHTPKPAGPCATCGKGKYTSVHYWTGTRTHGNGHDYVPLPSSADMIGPGKVLSEPTTYTTEQYEHLLRQFQALRDREDALRETARKLRKSLVDVTASLNGWMEIAEKQDQRKYDYRARNIAVNLLKETLGL